jgi:hypothetical protein
MWIVEDEVGTQLSSDHQLLEVRLFSQNFGALDLGRDEQRRDLPEMQVRTHVRQHLFAGVVLPIGIVGQFAVDEMLEQSFRLRCSSTEESDWPYFSAESEL